MARPMRRVIAAVMVLGALAGCSSSPSARSRLLTQMHKLTPNTPDRDITTDADTVCSNTRAKARAVLLADSMAAINGLNGLSVGPPPSAALVQYVDRIILVAHDVHYC